MALKPFNQVSQFHSFISIELFNEDTYYKKISDILSGEQNGLSVLKLAHKMHINIVLMKEHIEVAEERGFVCRDESYEGVLWFNNRFNLISN